MRLLTLIRYIALLQSANHCLVPRYEHGTPTGVVNTIAFTPDDSYDAFPNSPREKF